MSKAWDQFTVLRCLTLTLKWKHRSWRLDAYSLTGKSLSIGKIADILGPWQLQMSLLGGNAMSVF